jgi:hypothetical protein
MRIRESWLSFWCMCHHALCVLEGDPTVRQPAGSFILFVLEVEIQSYFLHSGLTIDFFRFLSESLYLFGILGMLLTVTSQK